MNTSPNTTHQTTVPDAPLERLREKSPARMILNYHAEIPLSGSFELAGAPVGEKGFYFIAKQPESKNFEGFVEF